MGCVDTEPMDTVPIPDPRDMVDAAATALRDAGVRTQDSARAMLAMWARLGQLGDAARVEVVSRFESCDLDAPDPDPGPGAVTPAPVPPNAAGFGAGYGPPLPPVAGDR